MFWGTLVTVLNLAIVHHSYDAVLFYILKSLFCRFLAPLEAVAVIVWWAVDLMFNEKTAGDRWYEFGTETFMMTMTQVSQLESLSLSL